MGKTVRYDYGLRDDLRAYVNQHPGDPDGVLVVNETGSCKHDTKSPGGQRRSSGFALVRVEPGRLGVLRSEGAAAATRSPFASMTTGGTCREHVAAQKSSETSTCLGRGFGSERPRMLDSAVTPPPTGSWSAPGGWDRERLARRPLTPNVDGECEIGPHLRCTPIRTSDDHLHRHRGGNIAARRRPATS
ncbi:hypothetical protein [Nocardia xishanensis]|uniref:hypothetical protein n=1 Tax=Nocardia xishanensis TaxID=238964 RepID=UPI0034270E91